MKTKKIKRLSIVMSLLLLFNSLGMFAADTVSQDEIFDSSLTENAVNTSYTTEYLQSRMGKYYSELEDALVYGDDQKLMSRANCYGYAFRMFYAPNLFPLEEDGDRAENYKQQPGEFAIKSTSNPLRIFEGIGPYAGDEVVSIANYDELINFYDNEYHEQQSMESRMAYLVQLIQADAAALGYTVTEYTGTTIPDAITNTNKRLIAVVAGPGDFHFYMQHANNKWSHKRGAGFPQSTCIGCTRNVLTNANIRTHACEGDDYEGGIVKFFYVTKDAIKDFNHRDGTSSNRTIPYTENIIGNHRYAAKDIGELPDDYLTGTIDYPGDVDFYSIFTSEAETRTIGITSYSGYNIRISVYNGSTLVGCQTTTSDATFTVDFDVDTVYFISVEALDFYTYEYAVSYDIW